LFDLGVEGAVATCSRGERSAAAALGPTGSACGSRPTDADRVVGAVVCDLPVQSEGCAGAWRRPAENLITGPDGLALAPAGLADGQLP
jgi:hypothetical protein